MNNEITLKKVYHTTKGKLRAQVAYAGSLFTLKIDVLKNKQQRVSFISMPTGLVSFGIQRITKQEDEQSITLELYYPNGRVKQDLTLGQSVAI
jgi:hypothetical protein